MFDRPSNRSSDGSSGEGRTSVKEDGGSLHDEVQEAERPWADTVLKVHDWRTGDEVLRSDIEASRIKTVTFLDSLDGMPEDAWDVSAGGNRKVMAWVVTGGDGEYDLYIGGEGGVAANTDSSYLFWQYHSVELIQMNDNFHTENAADMEGIFEDCESLTHVDVSGFDTSNVKYTREMFLNCNGLTSLNVSNFTPEQIDTMGISDGVMVYK